MKRGFASDSCIDASEHYNLICLKKEGLMAPFFYRSAGAPAHAAVIPLSYREMRKPAVFITGFLL